MLMRLFNRRMCCLISTVLLLAVTGCSKEKESKSTPPADSAKSAKSEAEPTAAVEAKLAQADLLDGKADKIVTRCASCALRMNGTSDHTLKVLDYTLYFCTERCAKTFAEDTTKAVLALEIPEG
ncbi:unnamed protein product [marine sediment metagenome]|uniref:TRASH domain-containing protein n=1 Tax=marine sediment metagenome TaxID=412755 RepID=X0YLB3_9ZZZZ